MMNEEREELLREALEIIDCIGGDDQSVSLTLQDATLLVIITEVMVNMFGSSPRLKGRVREILDRLQVQIETELVKRRG